MGTEAKSQSDLPSSKGIEIGPKRSGRGLASPQKPGRSFCAFWIGRRCYGLDTALVGEMVTVEDFAPVPLSPAPVMGVFSLRGTPVALISLSAVLGLPDEAVSEQKSSVALVLRTTTTVAAVL